MPEPADSISLAIEASGPDATVAVARGDSLLHLEPVSKAARHDDDLMPAIDRAFRRINATPRDLRTIYVSVGPGGFTGLRIAVSAAKMLAFATGCALFPIPEADAIREAADMSEPMLICLGGKRGCYWTLASGASGAAEAQVLDLQQITQEAAASGIRSVAVNQPAHRVADLAQVCTAHGLRLVCTQPDASHVSTAGRKQERSHPPTPPADLLPIYPREPEAVRLWRERQR